MKSKVVSLKIQKFGLLCIFLTKIVVCCKCVPYAAIEPLLFERQTTGWDITALSCITMNNPRKEV